MHANTCANECKDMQNNARRQLHAKNCKTLQEGKDMQCKELQRNIIDIQITLKKCNNAKINNRQITATPCKTQGNEQTTKARQCKHMQRKTNQCKEMLYCTEKNADPCKQMQRVQIMATQSTSMQSNARHTDANNGIER